MSTSTIAQSFAQSPQQQELRDAIAVSEKNTDKIHLKGLVGSSLSFVVANAFKEAKRPFLIVLNDKEEAAYHLNDLEQLVGEDNVLFYPGSYRRPYQIEETDNANVLVSRCPRPRSRWPRRRRAARRTGSCSGWRHTQAQLRAGRFPLAH